ncbi:hypothetical protein Q9966_011085 [Columba livia]|nr:hypothetical protein Q9966_011085 [Columba livia]
MEVEWLVSRAGERGVRPCPQRGSEQAEVSVAFALRFLGGKELLVKADEMEWITTRRVVQSRYLEWRCWCPAKRNSMLCACALLPAAAFQARDLYQDSRRAAKAAEVLNQHAFRYICNVAEDNKMKLIQAAILKCCPSYVIVHREKAM